LKGFALAEFLLRRDVGSMKKELIASNLTLTDGESTEAWQVYEQYSAELSKVNDTRTTILKEYSREYDTLSDDQALDLIRRWLETDIEQSKTASAVRGDLSESPTWKESRDLATGTAHRHDDGCAAYIGTSPGPEL
jgi:hypothetical protein